MTQALSPAADKLWKIAGESYQLQWWWYLEIVDFQEDTSRLDRIHIFTVTVFNMFPHCSNVISTNSWGRPFPWHIHRNLAPGGSFWISVGSGALRQEMGNVLDTILLRFAETVWGFAGSASSKHIGAMWSCPGTASNASSPCLRRSLWFWCQAYQACQATGLGRDRRLRQCLGHWLGHRRFHHFLPGARWKCCTNLLPGFP